MSKVRRLWVLAAAAATLLVVATACGGGGGGGGGGVDVTEKEYSITLSTNSGSAGDVTFNISNQGEKVHEFVVFKTDLAEDALPVTADEVDEDSPDLTLVDEKEDIAPGDSTDLTVDLDAGSYVVICNITGHYEKGMHAAFTVS